MLDFRNIEDSYVKLHDYNNLQRKKMFRIEGYTRKQNNKILEAYRKIVNASVPPASFPRKIAMQLK